MLQATEAVDRTTLANQESKESLESREAAEAVGIIVVVASSSQTT